jgi:hypothetical protein
MLATALSMSTLTGVSASTTKLLHSPLLDTTWPGWLMYVHDVQAQIQTRQHFYAALTHNITK